jgi:flagellum-specific peptidoglycan hydrolase FlgJ
VLSARKPTWQQATALVSLSTCGAMTGISFAHGTLADMTSPASMPVHLMAFDKAAKSTPASDSGLRTAIVNAASYYLRLAQRQTPAQMETMIWQQASIDGADHGASCAAFASLALQAGAQAAGQQSWVTGGTSYPWPVHAWVDARVDPNAASPGIVSMLQDAEAHHRWHPLGDGYTPQPGDWVLFPGHVEVVTKYAGGVLDTIGGDSLPNFSVNAHQYDGPLAAQGVTGFVNNGELVSSVSRPSGGAANGQSPAGAQASDPVGAQRPGPAGGQSSDEVPGQAAIPGMAAPTSGAMSNAQEAGSGLVSQPAGPPAAQATAAAAATIPGAQPITGNLTQYSSAPPVQRYGRSQPELGGAPIAATGTQQSFISEVAPGALAAQREYGVPAAVTIAQAIDESGWGQSELAAQDNNLFGIKGSGPAGSVMLPTQEFENGAYVTITAPFRVYDNVAQSIADHALLLATGSSYQQAMADRQSPDAFANDLTGVYATDPSYGGTLITIMRMYNLYRFDAGTSAAAAPAAQGGTPRASSGAASAVRQAASPSSPGPSSPGQGTAGQGAAEQAAPGLGATGRSGGPTAGQGPGGSSTGASGGASIPGLLEGFAGGQASASPRASASPQASGPAPHTVPSVGESALRAGPRNARVSTRRYASQVPAVVTTAFITTAKTPLLRSQPLYQDVARVSGIRWELLAACDWMQCKAQPRLSPVHGEKLGMRNADGRVYRTKSDALAECADDLVALARAVYGIELTGRIFLSIRDLAKVFAAFRWGGLLNAHHVSAMEFPYSVAGLTAEHMKMRWPDIQDPHAPDRPGSRFRMSFGAVPVLLGLDYPAVA